MDKKDIKDLIERVKNHTSKDGLNVITVFTKDNPNKNFNYLFNEGELRDFYDNWEILYYDERMTLPEKHGVNGKWHRHGLAEIMARRLNFS